MKIRHILNLTISLSMLLGLILGPLPQVAAAPMALPPVMDGIVDAEYGPVIASDPAGDSQGGNPVDLTNLWMTDDALNYYVIFEVNTDFSANNWGKYALYLDTSGDVAGAPSDAWGRPVSVSDPHKPEFAIYTYLNVGSY